LNQRRKIQRPSLQHMEFHPVFNLQISGKIPDLVVASKAWSRFRSRSEDGGTGALPRNG
jgi:hypothetical protein